MCIKTINNTLFNFILRICRLNHSSPVSFLINQFENCNITQTHPKTPVFAIKNDYSQRRHPSIYCHHEPYFACEYCKKYFLCYCISFFSRGNWTSVLNNEWFLGYDIEASTVGIVGFGNIGQEIAKRLKSFDVGSILYSGHGIKKEGMF